MASPPALFTLAFAALAVCSLAGCPEYGTNQLFHGKGWFATRTVPLGIVASRRRLRCFCSLLLSHLRSDVLRHPSDVSSPHGSAHRRHSLSRGRCQS